MTPSVRSALADLALDHVYVVHAGPHRLPVGKRVTAVPAADALVHGLPVA